MKCDQCCASVVSYGKLKNVFLHESGCPNDGKTWIDGSWIRFYSCDICGLPVQEDESCNCYDEVEA